MTRGGSAALLSSPFEALPSGTHGGIAVLASPEVAPWLTAVVFRLRELANLPEGWDSYGASRVSRHAIGHAIDLVCGLAMASQGEPIVGATASGLVALSWDSPDSSLDLTVGPDAAISYARVDKTDASGGQDDEGTSSVATVLRHLVADADPNL